MVSFMIKPINDNVVILPDKQELIGGIYVVSEKKPETGMVMESSSEEIKKGDTVLFKRYSATTVTCDKEEYLIIPREDILAVVC